MVSSSFHLNNKISSVLVSILSILTLFSSMAFLYIGINEKVSVSSATPVQSLVSWGSNAYGLLGDGQDSNIYTIQQSSNVSGITQASVGSQHTIALRNDGKIVAWGHNGYGQLGQGYATPKLTSVTVKDSSGNDFTGITQVSAAGYMSAALRGDGTIWQWGKTINGVFNTPTQVTGLPTMRKVIAHAFTMYGISNSNEVWTWGSNRAGRLGIGNPNNNFVQSTPIQIPGATNVRDLDITKGADQAGGFEQSDFDTPYMVKNDNTLWAWAQAQPYTNCPIADINYLAPPSTFPYCTRPAQVRNVADPSGFMQGINKVASSTRIQPPFLSSANFMLLGTDNRVYLASLPTAGNPSAVPITEYDGLNITDFDSAISSEFLRSASGNVYSFGNNEYGRTGNGNPTTAGFDSGPSSTPLSGITNVAQVVAGNSHTIFVKNDGTVWSVGENSFGQTGVNAAAQASLVPRQITDPNLPPAQILDIQATRFNTYFLRSDGTVWSIGIGTDGRNGNGTNNSANSSVQVSGLTGITRISSNALAGHALALRNDGTVWAWGKNVSGQLGNGTNTFSNIPVQVTDSTSAPLANIIDIEAGYDASGAIRNDGTAFMWGSQQGLSILGLGGGSDRNRAEAVTTLTNVSKIGITRTHSIFISNGNAYTAGQFNYPNPPTITPVQRTGQTAPITDVSCGEHGNYSLCTILDNTGRVGYIDEQGGNVVYSFAPIDTGVVRMEGDWDSLMWQKADGILRIAITGTNGELGNNTNVDDTSYTATPLNLGSVTQFDMGFKTGYAVGLLVPPLNAGNVAQIQGITYTCNPGVVQSTTTCSFILPANSSLPTDFKLGIGNAAPGGTCSQNSFNFAQPITVTCLAVPIGSVPGNQPIIAQIGANPVIDTGETVNISSIIVSDVYVGTGTCTPNSITLGDTSDCTFPLVNGSSFQLPIEGLFAGITNTTGNGASMVGNSDSCSINAANLICNNVPSIFGANVGVVGSREVVIRQPTLPNNSYFLAKGTITIANRPFNPTTDLPNLDAITSLACTPTSVLADGTTTCTGTFPATILPPSDLTLNVQGETGVLCTITALTFSCPNMPAGSTLGARNIQAKTGSSAAVNTGEVITVNVRPFNATNDFVNFATTTNLTCTPTSTTTYSTFTCTGTLPNDITPPTNLALNIEGATGKQATFVGQTFTATGMDSGIITGQRKVQALQYSNLNQLNYTPGTKVDTGTTVTVTNKILGPIDFPNIGSGNANDPFQSLVCGQNGQVVSGTTTTTCVGTLKQGYQLPSDFKLGTVTAQGTCTQSGQSVNCTNVSVQRNVGTYPLLIVSNGQSYTSAYRLSVVAAPTTTPSTPVLPRTGGLSFTQYLALLTFGFGILLIIAIQAKKHRLQVI